MKYIRQIQMLLVFLSIAPLALMAQDCVDYHKLGDCMTHRQKGYKIYSQSKSVSMSPTDTVEFNVIFYGQKDYIFSFCTRAMKYPVHFVVIDPDTGDVLYDNAKDRYIESLGIGFDVTKSLTVKVNVLAREAASEEIDQYASCLGLLIQYRDYPIRK